MPASATATVAAPEAPTAPDTGQPTAAAGQLGAANVDVSVRVASPGDSGTVTQVVSAGADAAQTAVQSVDTTQAAPSNVNISIRIASPGADGPVTQTIDAGAAASTAPDPQYQPGDSQYQAPAPTQPTSASPAPTPAPAPTTPADAAPAPTTSSLPTAWNWTWTWTCGDITGGSTTQTIDTGIQGWVWTWNVGSTCGLPPSLSPPIQPVNPTESFGGILPPTLPTPPVAPAVEPPTPPTLPLAQTIPPVVVQSAAPATAPTVQLNLGDMQTLVVPPAQLELPQLEPVAPLPRPEPAAAALSSVAVTFTAAETAHPVQAPPETTTSPRHRRAELPVLPPLPPLSLDAPTAPASAGGGGAGGSGVAAALFLWLLVQFPGTAVLRRPPRHRTPRARVDDIRNRPG